MTIINTKLPESVKSLMDFADLLKIADMMNQEGAPQLDNDVKELLEIPDGSGCERLLDMHDVIETTTLCRRTILNMEKRNEFPKRYRLGGRRKAWKLSEVVAWINNIPQITNSALIPLPTNPSENLIKKMTRVRAHARAGKCRLIK